MEVDDIQSTPQPGSKYSRVNSNGGRIDSSKIGSHTDDNKALVQRASGPTTTASAAEAVVVGGNRLRQWQHSSRIIRVSRASGGKDRHSKVWTAKGPRDRRVRLSVSTAIQFYDLQDRLGYDQPSKAVEWLIKAASDAINELPSLNGSTFPPETPSQLSNEWGRDGNVVDSGDAELDPDPDPGLGHNQMGSVSRSGCSSNNSETSKGSGLSLSRSEIRVKARERARERTAKEKERETEPQSTRVNVNVNVNVNVGQNQNQNPNGHQQNVGSSSIAPTSTFTQLLTAGISNLNEASSSPSGQHGPRGANANQWLSSSVSTTPMDYFGGLMGPSSSRANHSMGQIQLPQVMTISPFTLGGSDNHNHNQHEMQQQHHQHQQFPYVGDHHHQLLHVANTGGGSGSTSDYNLNFSISSSSTSGGQQQQQQLGAGFSNNRGTLQSNSPSLLPYLHRFSATTEGSSVPFFLGGAAIENHQHHQFQPPPGLQLCYGDGSRQPDQKGKGKN